MNYRYRGSSGCGQKVPMPMPVPTKIPGHAQIPEQANPTLNLFPIDEGFWKGTIYRGIYKPYKNYVPQPIMPANEKAALMFEVDKYYFAAHELRMYLDNYPNDREALALFNQFINSYEKAKKAYEAKYGAINITSESLKNSPFDWATNKFPWDGGM